MERETGFEPATSCLEGRDSTSELLPLYLPLRGAGIVIGDPTAWDSESDLKCVEIKRQADQFSPCTDPTAHTQKTGHTQKNEKT